MAARKLLLSGCVNALKCWNIRWHDLPNRRMREEWFTAVSFEAAISVAQEAFYGGEGYALIGIPVDLDSGLGGSRYLRSTGYQNRIRRLL